MERCVDCDCPLEEEEDVKTSVETSVETKSVETKPEDEDRAYLVVRIGQENHQKGRMSLVSLLNQAESNVKPIMDDFMTLTGGVQSDMHIVTKGACLFVFGPTILKISAFFPELEIEAARLVGGSNFCVPVLNSIQFQTASAVWPSCQWKCLIFISSRSLIISPPFAIVPGVSSRP